MNLDYNRMSIKWTCDISRVIDLIWHTAKKGATLLAMHREKVHWAGQEWLEEVNKRTTKTYSKYKGNAKLREKE